MCAVDVSVCACGANERCVCVCVCLWWRGMNVHVFEHLRTPIVYGRNKDFVSTCVCLWREKWRRTWHLVFVTHYLFIQVCKCESRLINFFYFFFLLTFFFTNLLLTPNPNPNPNPAAGALLCSSIPSDANSADVAPQMKPNMLAGQYLDTCVITACDVSQSSTKDGGPVWRIVNPLSEDLFKCCVRWKGRHEAKDGVQTP